MQRSFRLKLLKTGVVVAFTICFSCTHKREKQPIIWLYGYAGKVEMLYGNVKQVVEEPYGHTDLPIHFVYTFNKKGEVTKFEDIYDDGINTINYNLVYKNGKKAESVGIENNKRWEVYKTGEVYKYDNDGHIISFAQILDMTNSDGMATNIRKLSYDKAGYLTEEDEYAGKHLVEIHKYRYLYNEEGEIMGLERAHSDDWTDFKSFKKDTIRYILIDSKNNWLKEVIFGDTISRKITYY